MSREDHNSPEAVLIRIADAMTERAEPRCRHFGACGGCQLQHLSTESQLAAKQAMLVDILHRAGMYQLPDIQVHAAEPWRYRNRARFRVHGNEVGYSRRGSNEFLAISECPIASPAVIETAFALRDAVHSRKAKWPESTDSLEVFATADGNEIQISLHADATVNTVDRDAPRDLRALCDAVSATLPSLKGAGLSVNGAPDPSAPKRVQENARVEIARWGEPSLTYTVDGRHYRVTRGAFFQVNRFLTSKMVELVVGDRSGKVACDFFAGAGLFSVPLAERFDQVIAVEIGEPAATDLARHMAACGGRNRAEKSTVFDYLRRLKSQKADLIVLDPPRAGLGLATTRLLIEPGAPEIVYVSCDAGSFARDARQLVDSGYSIAALHLLDLFPQTFHTETVAIFRR